VHRLICLVLEGTKGKKTLLAIIKSMNSAVMKMKWRVSIQLVVGPLQMNAKLTPLWDLQLLLSITQDVQFIKKPTRHFVKKTFKCAVWTV
jgi:hypothetical protein